MLAVVLPALTVISCACGGVKMTYYVYLFPSIHPFILFINKIKNKKFKM